MLGGQKAASSNIVKSAPSSPSPRPHLAAFPLAPRNLLKSRMIYGPALVTDTYRSSYDLTPRLLASYVEPFFDQ